MTEGLVLILFTIYTVGMIVYNYLLGDGTRWEYTIVFPEDEDVRALKVAFWPLISVFLGLTENDIQYKVTMILDEYGRIEDEDL